MMKRSYNLISTVRHMTSYGFFYDVIYFVFIQVAKFNLLIQEPCPDTIIKLTFQ